MPGLWHDPPKLNEVNSSFDLNFDNVFVEYGAYALSISRVLVFAQWCLKWNDLKHSAHVLKNLNVFFQMKNEFEKSLKSWLKVIFKMWIKGEP